MTSITLHIMAEDALTRRGLEALFANHPEIHVYQTLSRMEELDHEDITFDDVFMVVIDNETQMSDLNLSMSTKAVALIDNEINQTEVLNKGFLGVFLRSGSGESLIAAVLAISKGLMVLSPQFKPVLASVNNQDILLSSLPQESSRF